MFLTCLVAMYNFDNSNLHYFYEEGKINELEIKQTVLLLNCLFRPDTFSIAMLLLFHEL